MSVINMIKFVAVLAALIFAYFLGFSNGKNSEELKHARAEVTALTRTIQEFRAKQTSDAVALSELRVAESTSRNELDRMRKQLTDIQRLSKTDADRQRNRCLDLAIRYKEIVERADRAIKFCSENHR